MMRRSFIVGTVVTFVCSILLAVILSNQEQGSKTESDSGALVQDAPNAGDNDKRSPYSQDTFSLMQAANIHVNLLGVSDMRRTASVPLNTTYSWNLPCHERVAGKVRHIATMLQTTARHTIQTVAIAARSSRLATITTNSGTTVVFVIFVIVSCLLCFSIGFLRKQDTNEPVRTAPRWTSAATERHVMPERQKLPSITGNWSSMSPQRMTPHFPTTSAEGTWASLPRPGSVVSNFGAFTRGAPSLASDRDLTAGASSQYGASSSHAADPSGHTPLFLPRAPVLESRVLPPPLCPTLVLPVCEARFGVPMQQLAQLTSEGEIGIVGMSGNALLRAAVKKVGKQRLLEICMPEANSAPRATVGPAGPGEKALEIRALKGAPYGKLEMRTSGACFVVKDGATVLTIDGDTDSLQLQIRSGHGVELASVRCCTEPFGGVDHVEVRVEPGVDTVLVLSCVLAVLLLSPYPPE